MLLAIPEIEDTLTINSGAINAPGPNSSELRSFPKPVKTKQLAVE
jgi:hypothetical protein